LDDGFVTTAAGIRFIFYGPNGTFDPTVLQLDTITEDVASVWLQIQALTGNTDPATHFRGPVTIMIGGLDANCNPCDTAALKAAQQPFFPDADLSVVRLALLYFDNKPSS